MVEWLAGGRIRGTSAERTTTAGIGNEVGGWVEVGRTTLGSNNANINVSSIPDKRYYMLLSDLNLTGAGTGGGLRLGSGSADTGSNYAFRASNNGGADGAYANRVDAHWVGGWGAIPEFYVTYIANLSAKEKLVMAQRNYGAVGAASAPNRTEFVGKWTNTSNPLDYINYYQGGSDQYASGSEVVVLGWDPADTHTSNFWEELASVELGSATSILSSGVFTSKKYLWVQIFSDSPDASLGYTMRFNSDSGSNYARRVSSNGATPDTTNASQAQLNIGNPTAPNFGNYFIINNLANEKLLIGHTVDVPTAGAGTAPSRTEGVGKWANTTSQITTISIDAGTGTWDTGSIIKVWGHD